ncbi:MAG: SusD/RagB family nutrient-binding outer membrane lipoprotein, partial [Bacteroidetes bacterium]|nr:SusD/RagB family nutrient-binding outer membrane lipoprotein [Bacteroidota bacterium]
MKKILMMLIVITGLSVMSCKKLEDLNVDKKNATEVTSATLFSNAQKRLVDQETT